MNWFQQSKVRSKLQLAFGLLLLLLLLESYLGYKAMRTIDALFDDVYINQMEPMQDCSVASTLAMAHSRSLYRYVAEPDHNVRDTVAENMDRLDHALSTQLQRYRKTVLTPEERIALKRFDDTWPLYRASSLDVMRLSRSDSGNGENNRLALQLLRSKTRPLLDTITDALQNLVDINLAVADRARAHSHAVAADTSASLAAGLVLALALGAFLAYLVTLSIMRQLGGEPGAAAALVARLAAGELTVPVELRKEDRSSLLYAIDRMAQHLSDTLRQIGSVTQALTEAAAKVSGAANALTQGAAELSSNMSRASANTEALALTVSSNARAAAKTEKIAQRGVVAAGDAEQRIAATVLALQQITEALGSLQTLARQSHALACGLDADSPASGAAAPPTVDSSCTGNALCQLADQMQAVVRDTQALCLRGLDGCEATHADWNAVLPDIEETAVLVQEIAAASKVQLNDIEHLNDAVQHISQGMQKGYKASDELSATARALKTSAMRLDSLVQQFKLRASADAPW